MLPGCREQAQFGYNRLRIAMIYWKIFWGTAGVAIEMTGGLIVNERGTVVTFRQRCEECGYVFDWNKTTIVPPSAPARSDSSPALSAVIIKR